MKTFVECFNTILCEDKEASRKAAREVRRLLYSSHRSQYKDIASIIENAPTEYEKLVEDWRQENFVMAISVLYFLHDREKQPDFLFPWLYHLIRHPSGNIRFAAVRMFEHEIGPLTVHIRFPHEEVSPFRELSAEQADRILSEMFVNLISLINSLWKPIYNKYKYIYSLPSGPYKSVQMVLGRLAEDCGKEYMIRLERSLKMS